MTATLARSAILDEAYRLADEGRRVFFLGRSKRPVANCPACRDADDSHDREACACLRCHGFFAATLDRDRIRAMHDATPGGMLAIRTGKPSGVVVVDVDRRNGGDAGQLVRRFDLPPTALVRTGSGDPHLYFRWPGTTVPNSAGRLSAGIDVRGDGGYVVAPTAIHPRTGRPYEWLRRGPVVEMPRTLVEACLPPPAPHVQAFNGPTSTTAADGIRYPDRLLDSLLSAVDRATPGTRRVALYGSSRGVARMVAAGAITADDAVAALTDAGRRAQQTERDILRAIQGGFAAEGVRL